MNSIQPTGTEVKNRRRGSGYPKRPSHFFHKYARWLAKNCFANWIGADGCWLLTVIASTEDSIRYVRGPNYFGPQLAPLCGWSVAKLARVRDRCVAEGLLHYEPGGKSVPGVYWVLVPESAGELTDGPLGEDASDFLPQSDEESARQPEGKRETTAEEPAKNRIASVKHPYLPLSESSPTPKPAEEDLWTDELTARVQTQLAAAGLADSLGTIEVAQGKGLSPQQTLAIVEEYLRRRSEFRSPGAIHWRITRGQWPDNGTGPNLDTKRAEHLQTKTQQMFAAERQHGAAIAEQRRELDLLEQELAAELDALPLDQLEKLVPDGPARRTLRQHGWRAKLIRSRVLKRFQEVRTTGGSLL